MAERATHLFRTKRRRSIACVACLVLGVITASCQDPTEVVVEVRTNVTYRPGIVTAFTVGSPDETEVADPSTETRDAWDADGFIGSLVLVPHGDKSAALSVKVVMGINRDTRECVAPLYAGCIVARRRLRYLPHERLRLPIVLYANCVDVPCTTDTTCSALGQCVSAVTDPGSCGGPEGCAVPGDPTPTIDAGKADADGDATSNADGAKDAAADATTMDARADAAGTAGYIQCVDKTCPVSQVCCLDQAGPTGKCAANEQGCNTTDVKLHCDGREDCGAGVCCFNLMFTLCNPASCSPYHEFCASGAGCTGAQKCVATSSTISQCQ